MEVKIESTKTEVVAPLNSDIVLTQLQANCQSGLQVKREHMEAATEISPADNANIASEQLRTSGESKADHLSTLNTGDNKNPSAGGERPKKRRRKNGRKHKAARGRQEVTSTGRIREQICMSARSLRKKGVSPKTLFFPSLPLYPDLESEIRAGWGSNVDVFKILESKGNRMAWATMTSEQACMDALLHIRITHPSIIVAFHNNHRAEDENVRRGQQNEALFNQKLQKVLAHGGIGNTLMFRNIPKEVGVEEFREVLDCEISSSKFDANATCHVLRVRTAIAKCGKIRNFWVVFGGVDPARVAFAKAHLRPARFRCGKLVKFSCTIHDDSLDGDEKKRRERSLALGSQPSKPLSPEIKRELTDVDRLESFLRESQSSFFFMKNGD